MGPYKLTLKFWQLAMTADLRNDDLRNVKLVMQHAHHPLVVSISQLESLWTGHGCDNLPFSIQDVPFRFSTAEALPFEPYATIPPSAHGLPPLPFKYPNHLRIVGCQ